MTLRSGVSRRFSTRQDFLDLFIARGDIADPSELSHRHDLLKDAAFAWFGQGQTGCQFSIFMAHSPDEYRWRYVVVAGEIDGETVQAIDVFLESAHQDGADAVVVILPDVNSEQDLRELIAMLGQHPNWYDAAIDPKEPPSPFDIVALRWVLPSERCVNWVLGFADIPAMPLTRRSPFTMLVVRTQERLADEPYEPDGRPAVHLADIKEPFLPEDRLNKIWALTEVNKEALLQDDAQAVNTARGRVTFVLTKAS